MAVFAYDREQERTNSSGVVGWRGLPRQIPAQVNASRRLRSDIDRSLADGLFSGRAAVIPTEEGGKGYARAIVDYKAATYPRGECYFALRIAAYPAAGSCEGLTVDSAYPHDLRHASEKALDVSDAAAPAAAACVGRLCAVRKARIPPRPGKARVSDATAARVCGYVTRGVARASYSIRTDRWSRSKGSLST